jgi:hypothetical protein
MRSPAQFGPESSTLRRNTKVDLLTAAKRAYRTTDWFIGRLAEKNYHSARAYYLHKLRRSSRRHKGGFLVIYTMGKVGSQTVQRSLLASRLDMPIYHVHFLTQDLIEEYLEKRKQFLGTQKFGRLKHIWLYEYLRKRIDNGLDGKRWHIVTLTREPISRNISDFFENIEAKPSDAGHQYYVKSDPDFYDFEIKVNVEDMSALVQLFLERLDHDAPAKYFDQELKSVFDIDVFSGEFPTSKGYRIYKGQRADVLLIRLENLNDCAGEAFKDFLGIEDFTLISANIGNEKTSAPLYRRFKNSVVLPESYVERMYDSKYMRHFYSDEEIARFRAKWRTSK